MRADGRTKSKWPPLVKHLGGSAYLVGDPLGQRLSVTVVKGTGLPAMDSNGKSDVYATLEVRFNAAAV